METLNSQEIKDTVKGMKESEMSILIQILINEIEVLKLKVDKLEKIWKN